MKTCQFKMESARQIGSPGGDTCTCPRAAVTARRSSGFTLIEIMVVIAIAAIVTAITVGAFSEISASNKRTTCQGNLSQLYTAARLYAADEGGKFPFFDAGSNLASTSDDTGIGLWTLYAFPDPASANGNKIAPIDPNAKTALDRYLRHPKVFHCPNDYNPVSGGNHESLYTDATKLTLNPDYLSYQVVDGTVPTYQSVRTTTMGSTPAQKEMWRRQLLHFVPDGSDPDSAPDLVSRPPADNTVVAWCKWHRGGGSRNFDNVLFYDGTVQLLPASQDNPDPTGPTPLTDWQRVPKPAP